MPPRGVEEVKDITYRDKKGSRQEISQISLSLNFWKPKGRWGRDILSGGTVVSMSMQRLAPKQFNPHKPGRNLVSEPYEERWEA